MKTRRAFRPSVDERLDDRLVPSPLGGSALSQVVHAEAAATLGDSRISGSVATGVHHPRSHHRSAKAATGAVFHGSPAITSVPIPGALDAHGNGVAGAFPSRSSAFTTPAAVASLVVPGFNGSVNTGGLENGFVTTGGLGFENGFAVNNGVDITAIPGLLNGFSSLIGVDSTATATRDNGFVATIGIDSTSSGLENGFVTNNGFDVTTNLGLEGGFLQNNQNVLNPLGNSSNVVGVAVA